MKRSYAHGTSATGLVDPTIGEYLPATVAAFPDAEALVSRHHGIRRT